MTDVALGETAELPWYREITAKQWYALFAGQAGWALDAFDVLLYVFCLTTIMKEWHLAPAAAGFMVTVTLFASSLGGILFGAVADRIGRKKALMLTVLLFSVCSGLSGLAQGLTQLAIARTILGLGMGGEWASGALLVSEAWPARHRGKAVGMMQGGWAIGYILAAIAAALVLPIFGWRVMFFLGILPALFTLWVRSKVDESQIWLEDRRQRTVQKSATGSFLQIFRPDLLRYTLYCTLISTFVMFAYWGLFSWLPGFLSTPLEKGGAGLSLVKAPLWVIPTMIGAFFGYVSFGFIADRFGRRPTFAVYLIVSAVLVCVYGNLRDPALLMVMGPFIGFFGSGYFSAFGAFVSELFPTRARGAAVGFTYNTGRMLSALAPTVIGFFSVRFGVGGALTFTAIAFVAGGLTIFVLPETKGATLT
ncbi:MAG TPA: MFS transporter [Anaeromyxobacteraceae bacterium]|nr:MFS transporter [Anaeromyxobacteraceae bacterium]